jgi:hypothetical protein
VDWRPMPGSPRALLVTGSSKPAISPPLFTKLDQESRIGRV